MSNYKLHHMLSASRVELHDMLDLTGCEISVNDMAPNQAVPFVHSHKQNEEVYMVIAGNGLLYIDGEVVPIKRDDVFRIDPSGHRCLKAGVDGMRIICIQTKQHSLENYTMSDGVMCEDDEAFTKYNANK